MTAITVRLIITPASIHKLTINKQDGWGIEDIIFTIMLQAQEKNLELPQQFQLMYYDKEFNDYFSIVDGERLTNLCTLKVVETTDVTAERTTSGTSTSESDFGFSLRIRTSGLIPNPFKLPQFPSAAQLVLSKGQH